MQIISASHLDHGLNKDQINFITKKFADRTAFFIETVEFPTELGTVLCGLYGPAMGDDPIAEKDVVYKSRGNRTSHSRMLNRDVKARATNKATVIAGPYKGECDATGPNGPCLKGKVQVGPAAVDCSACNGTGEVSYDCVLYTTYGGPAAPKEPTDPTIRPSEVRESDEFWSQHALVP